MQTPKARPGLEVPKKKSPATTPRTVRKLKTTVSESPVSSPNPKSKTPKDQSPKLVERRSPRNPANEIQKKPPGRIAELESQLAQLQEDLERAKEQLNTTETLKREAQKEAEESKKHLLEITSLEDSRIEELRKLSQQRDKAWQSELEALQKQHTMDSTALGSAMNELRKLKVQLSESEAVQPKYVESTMIHNLRTELSETLSLVEKLRAELHDSRESEARAHETVTNMEKQLEIANVTVEMLRSDGMKTSEAYNSVLMELEQSKDQIKSLEELVENLQCRETPEDQVEIPRENEEVDRLNKELSVARIEISQLKSELEIAETRYHEEYIQSTLQIRSSYEQVETAKSEFFRREVELEEELKKTKDEVQDLRERLMDNEIKLQGIAEENEGLNSKIKENEGLYLQIKENEEKTKPANEMKELEVELAELKSNLMDNEMELQSVTAQNETLRTEIEIIQSEKNKTNYNALSKLGNLTDEAGRSSKGAEDVAEQLGAAAHATNTELETELRRLKVQCDQWRKAAEAAASMLSGGDNGKYVARMGSLESLLSRNMNSSPFLDDMDDDDSPKKKNGNMLKKIGVLLKKGPK